MQFYTDTCLCSDICQPTMRMVVYKNEEYETMEESRQDQNHPLLPKVDQLFFLCNNGRATI